MNIYYNEQRENEVRTYVAHSTQVLVSMGDKKEKKERCTVYGTTFTVNTNVLSHSLHVRLTG